MYNLIKYGDYTLYKVLGGVFMFKDNKRISYMFIGIAILFTMLAAGYMARFSSARERAKNELNMKSRQVEENIKKYEENERLQTTIVDKNTITAETKILYKTKYHKCHHEITKSEAPKDEMIGLNRRDFERYVDEKLLGAKLIMFSKDEISLENEQDTLCPNHFVVGEKNGNIAIFEIDENGEKVLYRIFKDATISTLREENQKRLKQGIVVENEEEAIQVLEDFIS